jgi:uncharacterized membrane protein YfhO
MTGVIANGLFRFGAFGSNYAAGFVEAGKGWSLIGDGLASDTVRGREDTAAARCDSLGDTLPMCNTSMNHGINGTDFYFSLADGNVTRFMDDENVNVEMEHRYSGLDGRTILERLAAVRYCLADSDNSVYVPYGYCKVSETAGGYGLYEDKDSLPIGYIYENMMKYSDYEKLSAVKKQQAVLQCAAVPDQVYDSLKDEVSVNGIEYDDAEAKLSVSQGNGVSG